MATLATTIHARGIINREYQTIYDGAAQHVNASTNSQCSVTIGLIGALLDKER